jgi:hypothetical protein
VTLVAATFKLDGAFFFAHLTTPRAYSYGDAFLKSLNYVVTFQIGVAAALVWMWQNRKPGPRRVLVLAGILAHAVAFGFSGGDGVDKNIFFDAMIVTAIILSIALEDFITALHAAGVRPAFLRAMVLLPLIGPGALAAMDLRLHPAAFAAIPRLEDEFQKTVELVGSRPGRALCQDPLVCFAAAKPLEICMYHSGQQMKLGAMPVSDVADLIRTYRFQTIEMPAQNGEPVRPESWRDELMHVIIERYRLSLRTSRYAIFVPAVE